MKCPNCGSTNCEQAKKGTGEKTIDYIGEIGLGLLSSLIPGGASKASSFFSNVFSYNAEREKSNWFYICKNCGKKFLNDE